MAVEQLISDLVARLAQAEETRTAAQAEATRQTELRRQAERHADDLAEQLRTALNRLDEWQAHINRG